MPPRRHGESVSFRHPGGGRDLTPAAARAIHKWIPASAGRRPKTPCSPCLRGDTEKVFHSVIPAEAGISHRPPPERSISGSRPPPGDVQKRRALHASVV